MRYFVTIPPRPKPERSVVFLAVTLEESGLLGSKYYVSHPTFPLDKIAGVINIDAMSVAGRAKDVTVTVRPTLAQKKDILRNMVDTLRYVEDETPNIALLALVEQPSFHMNDTIEARDLVKEHQRHAIAACNLVGPIAYDLILSKEAARLKGYDNPLCGEFDGIVAPSLLAGNLIVKGWQMHAHARTCGVIVGAKIPVAITSRSDSADVSFLSLAFCNVLPKDCPYL
jgi:phosphotransacetylase